MRDIKFRGQSINTVGGGKPIKEWVYGCLIIDESCKNEYKYRIQPKESKQLYAPAVIPETISQYTGLKDKIGTDIYEGDIINIGDPNIPYGVVWADTGFVGKALRARDIIGLSHWCGVSEVMGNVFQ